MLVFAASKFYKTDRVFVKSPKQGKVWIATIIFIIMLGLLYVLLDSFKNWVAVFMASPKMIWTSILVAQFYATLQQVYYATATGLAFSYIHIFTNRIWLSVFLHFLLDLQPDIATENASAEAWVTILLIFGIVIIVSLLCIYFFNKRANKVFGY